MFKQRLENITFGRALACICTSFVLTMILGVASELCHTGIQLWVSKYIFTGLVLYRLWYVSKTPPPRYEDRPFGHM